MRKVIIFAILLTNILIISANERSYIQDMKFKRVDSDIIYSVFDGIDPIIKGLGKPNSSEITYTGKNIEDRKFHWVMAYWTGIKIQYLTLNQSINYIEITSPDYELASGIRIGSTKKDVIRFFGPSDPNYEGRNDRLYYCGEDPDDSAVLWFLVFELKGNKVKKIVMHCLV